MEPQDAEFVAQARKGRTFTFVKFVELSGHTEECITAHHWGEDLLSTARADGTEVTVRPATEEEIEEFILSGRMQDEMDGDEEFDRGFNEAREMMDR